MYCFRGTSHIVNNKPQALRNIFFCLTPCLSSTQLLRRRQSLSAVLVSNAVAEDGSIEERRYAIFCNPNMDQNMYELTTRIVEENDQLKTEVVWTFRNIQQILNDDTFKEVSTVVLKPHGDCNCDKFRHPKNIRIKLKLRECKSKKFDLYFMCEPVLPLQSNINYRSSALCKDDDINGIITEHFMPGWQLSRTILVDKRNVFLSIIINLTINQPLLIDAIKEFERSKTFSMVEVCDDMLDLFEEGTDSDVTLLSEEGIHFNVHKLILATRSKVFKAMLKHDKSTVIKTAYKNNVLSEILSYIYAGWVVRMKVIARELMAAADYYELFGLKHACSETLRDQLTPENAVEILELAEKYSCTELLEMTLQYIKNGHIDLVIKTEGWRNITSVHLLKRMLEIMHETGVPIQCSKNSSEAKMF